MNRGAEMAIQVNEISFRRKLMIALEDRDTDQVVSLLQELHDRVGLVVFEEVLEDISRRHPELIDRFKRINEKNSGNSGNAPASIPVLRNPSTRVVLKADEEGSYFAPIVNSCKKWEDICEAHYQIDGDCPPEIELVRYQWEAMGRITHLDPTAIWELKQLAQDGLMPQIKEYLNLLSRDLIRVANGIDEILEIDETIKAA